MKRTETYVLFRVNDASAIINAKFIRKKETEDYIFLSVPPTYDISVKYNVYENGKWQTKKQLSVTAKDLAPIVREYTQIVLCDKADGLPF